MYIQKLILKGYKRLRLTPIEYFEYNPTKDIQLIIGTNGSGKTSILEELSPLPADSKDFEKEGFKYIEILHNKSLYLLKSSFSPVEHSFIVDSEELNPGKTITIQRELVEKHFGLTNDIHQLALGKRVFSRMSVAERKQWFTRIADTDYEYAIRFFNKLKETHRDIAGALKVSRNRLTAEVSKIITEEEFKRLQDETELLDKCIDFLIQHKNPIITSTDELYNNYEITIQKLQELVNSVTSKILYFKQNHLEGLDTVILEQELIERKYHEQTLNQRATELYQQFQEIQEKIDFLNKTKSQNLAQIESEITKLENDCLELNKQKTFTFEFDSIINTDIIDKIENELEPILSFILPDPDKVLKKEFTALTDRSVIMTNTINQLQKDISTLKLNIEHAKKHEHDKEIDCPRCKYSWRPFFDLERIEKDQISLKIQNEKVNQLTIEHNSIKSRLQALEQHNQYTEYCFRLMRSYGVLRAFWEYILEKNIFYETPTQVLSLLSFIKKDIGLDQQVSKYKQEIKDKLDLLQLSQQYSDINADVIIKQKESIEKQQLDLQKEQSANTDRLNYVRKINNEIKSLLLVEQSLIKYLQVFDSLENDFSESIRRESYQELYKHIQLQRANKEQVFQIAKTQNKRVEDLKFQIELLESQEEALKLAVITLSPTEGLIAESLFGFMNLFIKQVNAIIKKIWTYPLIVKTCKSSINEKIDLDYKFPVIVDTPDNCRNDISEGSTAMQEVINLSFRIAAFKALGLNDYPIYLDEFGSSMDETHKAATVNLIQSLIEQDHFTQVFLISHDIGQYGALSNTQTLVLNNDNIQIPPGCIYNEHVIIQ